MQDLSPFIRDAYCSVYYVQATCWPNCVRTLSSWYTDQQKATIFGIWGTCTFAGGLMGTALAVSVSSKSNFLFNVSLLTNPDV